jgi:hypothetical protein
MEPVESKQEPKAPKRRPKMIIEKKLKKGRKSIQRYIENWTYFLAFISFNFYLRQAKTAANHARSKKRVAGKKKKASQTEVQDCSTADCVESSLEKISER